MSRSGSLVGLAAHRGAVLSSFVVFRGSLLAALGLSAMACSGNVETEGTGLNGSTGGGGAGAGPAAGCEAPEPVLQPSGEDSGFVKCADGAVNRVRAVTCKTAEAVACSGDEDVISCTSDADCTEKANGRCTSVVQDLGFGMVQSSCACTYSCQTDADCGPDSVCSCMESSVGRCLAAKCAGPDDCPSGECGLSEHADGCSTRWILDCRSPADLCHSPDDCPPSSALCAKTTGDTPWVCYDPTCTVGRPLVAGGALRFARPEARADWAARDVGPGAPLSPDTALSPELRAALAASFTEMAAMEHASVGSFARFALELLALGAPSELLSLTQQAMADEIRHAMLSYALAGAYGAGPVGPGPLPVAGVAPESDPRAIVSALVREACVGETVAAAEALALSHVVEDPALKAFWARIAEDEGRHAELGWRALAWMLAGGGEGLRAVAREAFDGALAGVGRELPAAPAVVSAAHGLLAPSALAALRAQAARDIVAPCARALLARGGAGAAAERAAG